MTSRPLRRDAEINRQRVVGAAREVFATRGLSAGLNDVAHHAGVAVGTVYRRFPDKEALIEAAFADRLDEMARLADEAAGLDDPWAGLVHLFTTVAGLNAADRGLRDLAFGAGGSAAAEHLGQVRTRLDSTFQRVVDRAHADGSLRAGVGLGDVLLALLMLSEVAHRSATVDPAAHDRMASLVLHGLSSTRISDDDGTATGPLPLPDVYAIAAAWLKPA